MGKPPNREGSSPVSLIDLAGTSLINLHDSLQVFYCNGSAMGEAHGPKSTLQVALQKTEIKPEAEHREQRSSSDDRFCGGIEIR